MHARVRAHDWAATPVGSPETWPQSLRALVRTLLVSRYPMVLTWGPQFIQFYNDAYAALIGDKHPLALGCDIRITLAESWDTLGPMIARVLETGVANWTPALPLLLERAGYREESYFSVSHAPAEDDDGRIVGMLGVCSEVTQQIVGDRRLGLLRDLAAQAGEARSVARTVRAIAASITDHPLDVPFLLIYLREAGGRALTLHAAVGLAAGEPASPRVVALDHPEEVAWPLARATDGETILVEAVHDAVATTGGLWGDPVRAALVMPISGAGQEAPLGVIVAGISPSRALDAAYRSFYELLAGQIAAAVRNALAHEEERQRAEALAELDRAKTAFFSNVSHEFRTPLTLLLGPLEDLLRDAGDLDPERRSRLDLAHRNALRLLKLVNTLLDFSRIEAGRAVARFVPTDLAALTADLASTFRSAIERAGLTLTVECPPLPAPLYLDRDGWEQIVLNLLSNALKHTFEGEIGVTVRAHEGHAELAIRDTGVGIPASELPRLFDRFHRVPQARSRSHEGTGIGLALVRELVGMHGGQIAVDSREGRGTAFTVRVPFGSAHLQRGSIADADPVDERGDGAAAFVEEARRWLPEVATPDRGGPPGTGTPPARLLLADDNADMRDYLGRLLAERYAVEAVPDGAAALAAALARPPDLVLTDVMMPGLDGFALLRALWADGRTATVPVVLLSARAGEEAAVEGLEAGADDDLVKPFAARELLARVASALELSRLRREVARREAEARVQAEAIRARDVFLSIAAHELRTPMTTLKGHVQLLRRQQARGPIDPARQGRTLAALDGATDRLVSLTNDLLDVSRIQTGQLALTLAPVDLRALAAEAVGRAREQYGAG
jgi:signal transduction histidine kinase